MTTNPQSARRWLPALLALAAPALQAAPAQWTTASGGNGHWYDYVPAISIFAGIRFDTAQSAAQASSHLGMAGYLATITSPAEQDFITASFAFLVGFGATGSAWLGASDVAQEGDWRWLGGPEAGQALGWTGWLPNHPVSVPEDHDLLALHINAATVGEATRFGWMSVHSDGGALGYIVEYGDGVTPAVPEPQALLLMLAGLGVLGWRLRQD